MIGRLKWFLVCLSVLMTVGLLTTKASAFSVQLRGGTGNVAPDRDEEHGIQAGIDVFIYEGRIIDILAGVEYTKFTAKGSLKGSDTGPGYFCNYDVSYHNEVSVSAFPFGIRIKYPATERLKPYVSLQGVYGTLRSKFSDTSGSGSSSNVYFKKSINDNIDEKTNFMAYRAGIGIDIGLGRRTSIGIEANYTDGIPDSERYLYTIRSNNNDIRIKVNDNSPMIGIGLGLRYYF
ncbi:MAG: hypothetical protein FJ241_08825 [Nitrospira sp.]|nr:hypothetical protein [Nitrospira sp.]